MRDVVAYDSGQDLRGDLVDSGLMEYLRAAIQKLSWRVRLLRLVVLERERGQV